MGDDGPSCTEPYESIVRVGECEGGQRSARPGFLFLGFQPYSFVENKLKENIYYVSRVLW